MKRTLPLVCLIFLAFPLSSLASPIQVAVSIPPQKYFCERVGGSRVEVTVMAESGSDPHSYEPTASQMMRVSRAQVYFAVGVPFEDSWLGRLTSLAPQARIIRHQTLLAPPDSSIAPGNAHAHPHGENEDQNHTHSQGHDGRAVHERAVSEAGSGHPHTPGRGPGHEHTHDHQHASAEHDHHHDHAHDHTHDHADHSHDPHIWVSPLAVARMTIEIRDALIAASPEHEADFTRNANAFLAEIALLQSGIRELFANLPPERRTFLTLHSAWGHYAAAFSLTEIAVELEGKEPGPRSMARILGTARDKQVRALVTEPGMSRNTVESLRESLKDVRLVEANALEENWPEFMRDFSTRLAEAMQ